MTESVADSGAAAGGELGPDGTALRGFEAVDGFFGDDPVDVDEPDEADEPDEPDADDVACCWNGSLLAKSVKLVSCPSSGVGDRSALTTSESVPDDDAAAGVAVGAAAAEAVGVLAAVPFAGTAGMYACWTGFGFSSFIVFGN